MLAYTPAGEREDHVLLESAPALALLAALAAVCDLVVNRVVLRGLADALGHGAAVDLARWGMLPRNLAAVAGLVALGFALVDFIRIRGHLPLRRRIVLAAFAGIFLPTALLATVLPEEKTTTQVVLLATGAANVLAVLTGLTAVRFTSPPALRIGLAGAITAVFFAFAALVLAMLGTQLGWNTGYVIASAMRRVGEIAYLLTAVPVGLAVFAGRGEPRGQLQLALGLGAAFALMVAMFWGRLELRAEFAVVLYGAQRVELFIDTFPLAYALPLALATGVGIAGLASASAAKRQAACGLLLVLAAGYSPKSPGPLLVMVLGLALLSRATMSSALRPPPPVRHIEPAALAELERLEAELDEEPTAGSVAETDPV